MFDRLSLGCDVLCKAKVGLLDSFVKLGLICILMLLFCKTY